MFLYILKIWYASNNHMHLTYKNNALFQNYLLLTKTIILIKLQIVQKEFDIPSKYFLVWC